MKLWIVNVDTRTKVLLKFGNLETVCVDVRSKNLFKLPHYRYMSNLGLCMGAIRVTKRGATNCEIIA